LLITPPKKLDGPTQMSRRRARARARLFGFKTRLAGEARPTVRRFVPSELGAPRRFPAVGRSPC